MDECSPCNEGADATAKAVRTAADAADTASALAAHNAATRPNAAQTAAIAAAAADMIAETAAAKAETVAINAASHAFNVRDIARALAAAGAAAADLTPAITYAAAAAARDEASEAATDAAAIRAFVAHGTLEDFVSAADNAFQAVTIAVTGSTSAATMWRRAVVVQGDDARAGAVNVALGRGLHSSTFQLNFSALYGIGGARRDCVARVKGVLGAV